MEGMDVGSSRKWGDELVYDNFVVEVRDDY